jgi:hypothetical protein
VTAAAIDPDHVEALLQAAARAGESMSYGEVLAAVGLNFSRPRMRALCALLADLDARARGRGEPELAVLVVRQSDRLPGQGWWVGGRPARDNYAGPWDGPEAAAYIRGVQRETFDFWRSR